MTLHILRLGSPRTANEGLRLGTVRRPPRGVPKSEFASRDFYDLWLPLLSPSAELMAEGKAAQDDASWAAFQRKFRKEMESPAASQMLDLLAAMSRQTDLAIGCYCEDERHCHRAVLRELLQARSAELA